MTENPLTRAISSLRLGFFGSSLMPVTRRLARIQRPRFCLPHLYAKAVTKNHAKITGRVGWPSQMKTNSPAYESAAAIIRPTAAQRILRFKRVVSLMPSF